MKSKEFRHKRIVVDCSVLMKYLLKEQGRDFVGNLIRMNLKGELTLLATSLLRFEVANVLAKRIKEEKVVKKLFDNFMKLNIGFIEPDRIYIHSAIEDACEKKNVSYYDASYHALAKDMDAIFLTADKRYYEEMKNKGSIALFE